MRKTDVEDLPSTSNGSKASRCQSCRSPATRRVTYEGPYAKIIVCLCDRCTDREYYKLVMRGPSSWMLKSGTQ